MSTKTTSPVSHSATGVVGFEPGRLRTDEDIQLENLTDEEQEVVEADEFIVYGKANIEQWDDRPEGEQLFIQMEALEDALDQLLALNNISRRHDDTRVGEPLEEYTLDEPSTVHLDEGESLELEAGDTIRAEVIREGEPLPGDNGDADESALWLPANLFGRSDTEEVCG